MAIKKYILYKDLALSLLAAGTTADDWEVVIQKLKPPKRTIKKAVNLLADMAIPIPYMFTHVANDARAKKKSPTVGETRIYTVQRLQGKGPFIRLPLDSLDIEKGEKVKVAFLDGLLSITKAEDVTHD